MQLLQPPMRLPAESPGTRRSVASFGLFFRIRFDNLFRFCSKNIRNSTLQAREKTIQRRRFLKKNFPAKPSWCAIEGCFENPDKNFGRNFEIYKPIAFFSLIFSRKASSDCFSRHVDSSLDHVFWIFDRKRLSISSQIFKHSRFLQKKRQT